MLALQEVLNEQLKGKGKAQGYELSIDTFIKGLEVNDSAIVWVNMGKWYPLHNNNKDNRE